MAHILVSTPNRKHASMPRIKKTLPFFDLYDKFVQESKTGRRLQPNGKRLSPGTLQNYAYTRNLLQQFCVAKAMELRLKPVKHLTKREQTTEKNYWKRFYKKFTDYLYTDCGHFDNYVGQNIKNLRVFFNYLNKDLLLNIGDFHKQFYVRKEEIPVVTLLPEELNYLIYNQELEEKLNSRLQRVRDMFVFGCTVALRVSDLLALKKSNLRIAGDNWYLVVRSQKTKTDTQVKLPDYAVAILKKYKFRNGKLLPHFNKVNLNVYVKQLLEVAGFTHPVGKAREVRGRVKEMGREQGSRKTTYRFCDLVTTHTMRRTAITVMLSLGTPEQVVRKISGHSAMSKEFFRYVAVAQAYQDKATADMFDRLKQLNTTPLATV
jgi:integrase